MNNKLNLGSGGEKIANCDNVDIDPKFETELCFDFKVTPWPIETNRYEEVYFFHVIEHIEKRYHKSIFSEIARILKPKGTLYLSYPEFEIIAQHWLNNEKGQRDYWERTLFGLQRTPSDYHVCAMSSEEVVQILLTVGFTGVIVRPESVDTFNTIITGHKVDKAILVNTYEKVLYDEVLGIK